MKTPRKTLQKSEHVQCSRTSKVLAACLNKKKKIFKKLFSYHHVEICKHQTLKGAMRILKWVGGLIYSYCFSLHGALTLSLILLLQFFLYFVNKICEWSWFWTGFKKKQNHTNSHVYRYQSAVSSHLTACYIPKHFKWVLSKFEKVIITQVTSVPPPLLPPPHVGISRLYMILFSVSVPVFFHMFWFGYSQYIHCIIYWTAGIREKKIIPWGEKKRWRDLL